MTGTDTRNEEVMTEPLYHDVNWNIDYKVRLGTAWSKFMRGLQQQQLLGSTCTACARTFVPPQSFCEFCFEPVTEWVELEPVGTLRASTVVYQGFAGGPEAPYAVGAIEIDGTQSLLMHFLGGVELADSDRARKELHNGLRVRAEWSEERSAAITDIKHFVPTSD